MIGVFIYGELIAKRNFQLIIDTPVKERVERAQLLGHQMIVTSGNMYGARPYALSSIDGLLYYLTEEQVHSLMNYYGGNFRLCTGSAKVGGIERPVKFMAITSGVGYIGYCNKDEVEKRLMSTSALYAENENERKFIHSTLQYLFPSRSVEWIASNYPYYVKWLRSAGYDAQYMLPSVQGLGCTRRQVAEALCALYPNSDISSRENIMSIAERGLVTAPIELSKANKIATYADVLLKEIHSIESSMAACGLSLSDSPTGYGDMDIYESLSTLCEYADTIEDDITKKMYLLLALRYWDLPLVDLSNLDGQQLNAYIINSLYINNLLEE